MIKNKVVHVFIDEMKNGSLPIEENCNNNYYVYASVVVAHDKLDSLKVIHNEILDKYFKQSRYLKTTKINNKNQWIDIANMLNSIDHYVAYLVVNMDKLEGDGFANSKRSFEKYFQNLINKRFLDLYSETHVTVDATGTKLFQDSLKTYMSKNGFVSDEIPNLFSSVEGEDNPFLSQKNSFESKDDKNEEPLLQIADFYAGAIGRYFRKSQKDIALGIDEIYNSIRHKVIPTYFPWNEISLTNVSTLGNDFNQTIFNIAVESAEKYLKADDISDTDREIVEILLSEARLKPLRFVSSKEIAQRIKNKFNKPRFNPTLSIGSIKDKEVLIISEKLAKSGGYKLPCNEAELHSFYKNITLNVIPQLRRLGIMNKILVENSEGTVNIMESDNRHTVLSSLLDITKNANMRLDDDQLSSRSQWK